MVGGAVVEVVVVVASVEGTLVVSGGDSVASVAADSTAGSVEPPASSSSPLHPANVMSAATAAPVQPCRLQRGAMRADCSEPMPALGVPGSRKGKGPGARPPLAVRDLVP